MKVSPEIQNLVPYTPGKPISETKRQYGLTTVHKLASNENALGFSPKVADAVAKAMREINRYPDPACHDLIETASQVWKVPREMLAVGNGSNEVIDLLIRIYCEPGEAIMTFAGAFIAYELCARAARVKPFIVPHENDFRMNLQAMAKQLREQKDKNKIRLVFIANPNNPTGVYIPRAEVDKFLEEFGRDPNLLIVFDEAYTEFVRAEKNASLIADLQKYPSVVVLRTLSKVYGLAGLRIGFLMAQPSVIDLFHRVRNPFNVNELAQIAATVALKDQDFVQKVVQFTWKEMDLLQKELAAMSLPVIPSQTNFLFFDTLRDVKLVNEALLKRGVILRPVLNYGYPTWMRITVGTAEENQAAVKALKEVLQEVPPTRNKN